MYRASLPLLKFSIYQSNSNHPFKPLTPLFDLWQGLFSGT
jgi:hypothetical protein